MNDTHVFAKACQLKQKGASDRDISTMIYETTSLDIHPADISLFLHRRLEKNAAVHGLYKDGYTQNEIASFLKITQPTVSHHLRHPKKHYGFKYMWEHPFLKEMRIAMGYSNAK